MLFIYIYIFIVGACLGSFNNVVATRMASGESFVKGRSRCDNCKNNLSWFELIPIVSYILYLGRCRHCKHSIGIRHLIIEIIDGVTSLLCFFCFGFSIEFIFYLMIFQILIVISLIDYDSMIIPDSLIIFLVIPVIAIKVINYPFNFFNSILGMISISLIMIFINCIVQDSFGGGDIKLMFVLGFLMEGKLTLIAGCIAVILAGLYAIYYVATGKMKMKGYIPFGPFLCLGSFISILYGEVLFNHYLSLFNL